MKEISVKCLFKHLMELQKGILVVNLNPHLIKKTMQYALRNFIMVEEFIKVYLITSPYFVSDKRQLMRNRIKLTSISLTFKIQPPTTFQLLHVLFPNSEQHYVNLIITYKIKLVSLFTKLNQYHRPQSACF